MWFRFVHFERGLVRHCERSEATQEGSGGPRLLRSARNDDQGIDKAFTRLPWGQLRTVDIARPGAVFCRVEYVERELAKRFEKIRLQTGRGGSSVQHFISEAAEHLSELNAIHPFREGNGRTARAFLRILGEHAGYSMAMERIEPREWTEGSRESFSTGTTTVFRRIIASCIG